MRLTAKISVVIPSFNKVEYIEDTLKSIFSQKYNDFEVIIQDGGSTDGTLEIIKNFSKRHGDKITWESKKDNGQLDAINKGLKKADGDILTYINADDVYSEGAFNKINQAYRKNPKSLWFAGRGIVVDDRGKKRKSFTYRLFTERYKDLLLKLNKYFLLLSVNYLMQPSVFITRKAYKRFGGFSGISEFVMEYDLWLAIGKYQMPTVISETLSAFRLGGDNITSVQYKQLLEEDMKIVKKHTNNQLILIVHRLNNLGRILSLFF